MGGGVQKSGRVDLRNYILKGLIQLAYGAEDYRISGGPAWISSMRYDIEGKPAVPASYGDVQLMLRALLADRFALQLHRSTTNVSGYILLAENGEAKLKKSSEEREGFRLMGPEQIEGPGTLSQLAWVLKGVLQAPVQDETGLTGKYDINLKWKPDETVTDSEVSLSIFTALKQQLGLRLKAGKVPIEMLIVDHVEKKPTDN
jgi:uncharacterized protein (TIGR03435 family)